MSIHGQIEFSGETLEDCERMIGEALLRIMDDYTTGGVHNESGSFSFEVEGVEGEEVS